MTEQEIKEIQREIRETQARLTALQNIADNLTPTKPATPQPEPWARWRAWRSGFYCFVTLTGDVINDRQELRDCYDNARYTFGNYFKTELLAQRHAKRLRSMVPTCAMPKDGETFYWIHCIGDEWDVVEDTWIGSRSDFACWFDGMCFLTESAAEAWIAEFGDVWTSRVEGEGE